MALNRGRQKLSSDTVIDDPFKRPEICFRSFHFWVELENNQSKKVILKRRSGERVQADLLLVLAAILWGGGFVAQRAGAEYLSFFAYNGIRFLLAGLLLLPAGIKFLGKPDRTWWWVVPAGGLLYAGSALQQAGLESTTAGAGGFITGLYVVLVPLFMAFIWKAHVPLINWLAAAAALIGTYLLSTGGKGLAFSRGDLLVLAGAVLWAFHVIVVGLASRRLNVFSFSAGQFLLCAALHLISSFFFHPLTLPAVQAAWAAIVYGGVFSVAGGFTLQALGQSKAPTTDASLILSLEAVFAAIFGALLLGEKMSGVQILGSGIIMAAILVVQWISIRQEKVKKAEQIS